MKSIEILFLEIGNGNTLSNMLKRMSFPNEFNAISLSSIKEIEKFMRDSYES